MEKVRLLPLNRADRILEQAMQEVDTEKTVEEYVSKLVGNVGQQLGFDCYQKIDELQEENEHLKGQLESLERTLVHQQEELDRMHRKILLGGSD